jgi:hypothetical protein
LKKTQRLKDDFGVSPSLEHWIARLRTGINQAVSEFYPRSLRPETCFSGKILNSWPRNDGLVETSHDRPMFAKETNGEKGGASLETCHSIMHEIDAGVALPKTLREGKPKVRWHIFTAKQNNIQIAVSRAGERVKRAAGYDGDNNARVFFNVLA